VADIQSDPTLDQPRGFLEEVLEEHIHRRLKTNTASITSTRRTMAMEMEVTSSMTMDTTRATINHPRT
jgi:hypothetical protein